MEAVSTRPLWVREALQLSQPAAMRIGVDVASCSLYEVGRRYADPFRLARIFVKFSIDLAYPLSGHLPGVERLLAILLAVNRAELIETVPHSRGGL